MVCIAHSSLKTQDSTILPFVEFLRIHRKSTWMIPVQASAVTRRYGSVICVICEYSKTSHAHTIKPMPSTKRKSSAESVHVWWRAPAQIRNEQKQKKHTQNRRHCLRAIYSLELFRRFDDTIDIRRTVTITLYDF